MADLGYFGPDSVSWRVHREVTVLFGGARAVLMQAAHPLVIAGARETGFYERNPWKRLQRTLVLTYTITFGSKAGARAPAGGRRGAGDGVLRAEPVEAAPADPGAHLHDHVRFEGGGRRRRGTDQRRPRPREGLRGRARPPDRGAGP